MESKFDQKINLEEVSLMKILLAYFSATGNTAKVAEEIRRRLVSLGAAVDVLDITSYSDRQKEIDPDPFQAFIFGAPVHSNRAPRLFREWLLGLDGKGRKCSTFFTYGGFKVHPSHYSTGKILKKRHFDLVSSAEFLGAHTFNLAGWNAMAKRPDQNDLKVAGEYALKTFRRFTGDDQGRPDEFEKTQYSEKELDAFEHSRYKLVRQLPTRDGKECSMCMICEELCPTSAMDAKKGEADRERCIICLRCIMNCPEDALKVNDLAPAWPRKLKMENETTHTIACKTSRIYL